MLNNLVPSDKDHHPSGAYVQVLTLGCVRVGLQHSPEGEDVPESAPPNRTFVWGTSVDIDDVSNRIQRFMRNFREGVEVEGKYMQLLEEVRGWWSL